MTKFNRSAPALLASAAVVAIAALPSSAFAQEAETEKASDEGLEVIIVQARKVNENLQDVPVAVTAFSGNELEVRSINQVQDIGRFTPGMSIRQHSQTPSALTFAVRGQVQTDILVTLDPSVGTYVDGVYWARAYGINGDFLDVESVQVLKGPQGTLFGRNTTGGALIINSNNPDMDDFSGKISLTYGRFDEFRATAVLNVPIVTDKIALRLSGQRFRRDGYTENDVRAGTASAVPANTPVAQPPFVGNPDGLKFDNKNRWSLRGKLDIMPTENLTLRFSGEYFKMNEVAPAREILLATRPFTASNSTYTLGGTAALFTGVTNGGPPPTSPANSAASTTIGINLLNDQIAYLAANPRLTSNNEVPYAFAKTKTFGFTGILDTSFGQIQLITGYRKVENYAGIDLEGSQYAIHFTELRQEIEQTSAELQFTGTGFDDALDYVGGAFVFHENGYDQSMSIVAPALNAVTANTYGYVKNDSIGLYGQGTWHINDKLSFTGGLRYSVDDKGLESQSNSYNRTTGVTNCSLVPVTGLLLGGPVLAVPQCAIERRDSFGGWSYTAGLEYKPTDDLLIYAKTAKGFRSGGQNLRAPTAAFFIPFKPEIAYSYEVGMKGEFFDRRARLNIAAYQTNVKDIQRSTLIANPSGAGASATVLGNAGEARFRGVEAELNVLIFEGLTLSLNGALVDPKYLDYSDLTGDRSFERFDSVAEEQFGVAADYSRDIGGAKLKLHADYAWTGKTPTAPYFWAGNPATSTTAAVPNSQNEAIVAATTRPAQGFLGARASLSFDDDRYEVAVFGRNITNNRDYSSNLLVAPVGYVSGIRTEPATYGVTVSAKF